jgi:hypothetical protein
MTGGKMIDVPLVNPDNLLIAMSDCFIPILNGTVINIPNVVPFAKQVYGKDYNEMHEFLSDEDYEIGKLLWVMILGKK